MGILSRVGKGSLIYSITTLLQRGVSFLLLPLYTRYLVPKDYGILSVVLAINAFLTVFVTLSMQGAVNRYYFLYRNDADRLKSFWGTVISFVFLVSIMAGVALLVLGNWLLRPVIGEIPFYPFVALGIGTAMFQPIVMLYLTILQTREQTIRYSILSFAQFLLMLSLIIGLVVLAGWKAEGPLTGSLVASVLTALVSLLFLRRDMTFGINIQHLKEALRYSVPLVPASLSGQITGLTDRLFVNAWISTASAGLYSIGFMFGNVIAMVSESVNRAYTPVALQTLTDGSREELLRLKQTATLVICTYCLLGLGISLFAREVISLVTTRAFYGSYVVVPFIAFGFVATGFYFVFSTILFFDKSTTKYVSLGTGVGAGVNVVLNILLIPRYGIIGAAVASLVSQVGSTTIIAAIGKRYEKIAWNYGRFVLIYLISAIVAVGAESFADLESPQSLAFKGAGFVVVFLVISFIAFGSPWALVTLTREGIRQLAAGQMAALGKKRKKQ